MCDEQSTIDMGKALAALSAVKAAIAQLESVLENKPSSKVELTSAEFEILKLLAIGLSVSEIAKRLSKSESTVKTQLQSIYQKLSVHNSIQALLEAKKQNLIYF